MTRTIPFALSALALSALLVAVPARGSSRPAAEEDGTYSIDAVHSSVIFRVSHLGISNFYGRFGDVAGTLVVDGADPAQSAVKVEIRADSIDTNNADRDKHVTSPDFLNAKQFPTLSFESTAVKRNAKGDLELTGQFTMHGVTKTITVEAVHVGHGTRGNFGYRTGYETTFTVKRSDYGLGYALDMLGDEVAIIVSLEATKD
ncbi:MAG: YceI family protein [Planctomycetota bacterium]